MKLSAVSSEYLINGPTISFHAGTVVLGWARRAGSRSPPLPVGQHGPPTDLEDRLTHRNSREGKGEEHRRRPADQTETGATHRDEEDAVN